MRQPRGSTELWFRAACLLMSALLVTAWIVDEWRVDRTGQTYEQAMPELSWGIEGLTERVGHEVRSGFTWHECAEALSTTSSWETNANASAMARSCEMAGLVRVLLIFSLVWLVQGWLPFPRSRLGAVPVAAGALALLVPLVLASFAFIHGGFIAIVDRERTIPEPVAHIGLSLWLIVAAGLVAAVASLVALATRRK